MTDVHPPVKSSVYEKRSQISRLCLVFVTFTHGRLQVTCLQSQHRWVGGIPAYPTISPHYTFFE